MYFFIPPVKVRSFLEDFGNMDVRQAKAVLQGIIWAITVFNDNIFPVFHPTLNINLLPFLEPLVSGFSQLVPTVHPYPGGRFLIAALVIGLPNWLRGSVAVAGRGVNPGAGA